MFFWKIVFKCLHLILGTIQNKLSFLIQQEINEFIKSRLKFRRDFFFVNHLILSTKNFLKILKNVPFVTKLNLCH